MQKTILLYGAALAALTGVLKFVEYRFFIRDLSLEIYLGVVAILCAGVGAWAGMRLTRRKVVVAEPDFKLDEAGLRKLGISNREYEVLELMAQGLSNQEIADKLFVSLNTVKTHASNLFMKLDARRRTQAVRRAKELGLLS
ncbi:MAG TPA: LuxR C-terminal-related transcriptional regulator [Blastocatellia bacterium]|nr:LuxR C-terminal-related transcriptional regulator [Blastocatellia bacterium]